MSFDAFTGQHPDTPTVGLRDNAIHTYDGIPIQPSMTLAVEIPTHQGCPGIEAQSHHFVPVLLTEAGVKL